MYWKECSENIELRRPEVDALIAKSFRPKANSGGNRFNLNLQPHLDSKPSVNPGHVIHSGHERLQLRRHDGTVNGEI